MIIVGSYPKSINDSQTVRTPLQQLRQVVRELPQCVALHVLPFGPADGDGGFATRDWFSVDPALGNWEDIKALTRQRRIVVDGIYNHVGLGHEWCREWIETGLGAERLHVFRSRPSQLVLSPRGASVFHPHQIHGRAWWAWQTFSSNAIDIQLGNADVQAAIDRHEAFLADLGISAVRLDSIAYYGKKLGERQRHHPLGIKYARWIAGNARKYGMKVIPQLNCDTWGEKYFPVTSSYDASLTDFAYSAVLVLTMLTGRPEPLVSHARRIQARGISVLRAMRTHDGILLKTSLLRAKDRADLIAAFKEYGVVPRIVERRRYEFNCSFPFACSLGTDVEGMWNRIRMTTALTACLPGVCYVYLPILYGFRPELEIFALPTVDPRSLNRMAMPSRFITRAKSSANHKAILHVLELLGSIREKFQLERNAVGDSIEQLDRAGIVVRRANGRLILIANLSRERSLSIPVGLGSPLIGDEVKRGQLAPLAFALWLRGT